MQQSCYHLSSEERAVIQVCRAQGQSLGAIAPALGRSAPMVSRRSGKSTASIQLGEERRIHARPQAIETRLTPGHWEGDLIMGAVNRSAVGTVVECETGFVLLCKLASKETLEVPPALSDNWRK